MLPVFNSLPYQSNQAQANGTPTTAPQQQVMPSNQFHGNPRNLLPQIQSQMGIINPQMPNPFNNSNTHLGNANNSFMNVPNQFFPFQNGIISPSGQLPSGYGSQNLNCMNQFSQLNGQLFTSGSMHSTPYLNQNISVSNGQFLQGPVQNLGQFVQMQMPNLAMFQASQGGGPQNPSFNVNQLMGLMHVNGITQQGNQDHKSANSFQLQGNSSTQPLFGSIQPKHTQNFGPQVFNNKQENPGKNTGINNMTTGGKNTQSRNFLRHPKHNASHGLMPSQARHRQNAKGKLKFHNKREGKGYKSEVAWNSGLDSPSKQTQVEKKRTLPLNYTEQEIQQWREARKRHYPSKTNLEKKLTKKMAEAELADRDAELRRQQLKEVLAKQAELGCEVAEIPAHYLSDSEKQGHGPNENKRAFSKKGRFSNKFNKKRGRYETDQLARKQRTSDVDSTNLDDQNNASNMMQQRRNNDLSTTLMKKREPTLLQKLLSSDVRRDRAWLLQVFRFMEMNSFFKDQPEKPLKFPVVVVKETQGEGELAEENLSCMHDICSKSCNDNVEKNTSFKETAVNKTGNVAGEKESADKGIVVSEEEEGEIVD